MVLGSCVAAGACFGRDALGRPGSGSAIQRGADVGGVVVAAAAERAGNVWTVEEVACFLFHVQWTSSCDHAATSSAVLYRISDRRRGGASASVHRQRCSSSL